MYLSRGRKFLFLHIPKTGGTALTLALEARALKDDIIVADTPKGRARAGRQKRLETAGRLWKHSTLADIDGLVTPADLADLTLLTLVRNPWDRLVSYYHWLRAQNFTHPAKDLSQRLDFSGFINHPLVGQSLLHWPAEAYFRDRSGKLHPAHYLRLEALAEDMEPFEQRLGFRLTPLARHNQSDRLQDWRSYYSDADAALIGRLCATDIARFGYRFDPF